MQDFIQEISSSESHLQKRVRHIILLTLLILSQNASAQESLNYEVQRHESIDQSLCSRNHNKTIIFDDKLNYNTSMQHNGWSVNTWGSPKPRYSISSHSDILLKREQTATYQQFIVLSHDARKAALYRPFFAKMGRQYLFEMSARAPSGRTKITVGLRHDKSGYPFFSSRSFELNAMWKRILIVGEYPYADHGASIRVQALNSNELIDIRDAKLVSRSPDLCKKLKGSRVPKMFFGMTINKLGAHNIWPPQPTNIIRLWDTGTRWLDLEPSPGEWNFKRADYYIKYARAHNSEVIFTLGQTPRWAAQHPNAKCEYYAGCSPPQNLATWRRYVRVLVNRYGADVRYWELWNEADYKGFWSASPEKLSALAKVADEEIHSKYPDAVFIGPSITPKGLFFIDNFLSFSSDVNINRMSLHYYAGKSDSSLTSYLYNLKTVLQNHDISQNVWVTEFGINYPQQCKGSICDEMRGSNYVKELLSSVLIFAAEGAENVTFFNWERRPPYSPIELSTNNYASVTRTGMAYFRALKLIEDSAMDSFFSDKNLLLLSMRKSGVQCLVAWSTKREGKSILHLNRSGLKVLNLVNGDFRRIHSRNVIVTSGDVFLVGEGSCF